MTSLSVGGPAPDFCLPSIGGEVRLSDLLRDGPVVVVFYQEDATPACRQQLAALRDDGDIVREAGARVVAISVDPLEFHRAFEAELRPGFPLLSDAGGAVARAWGVYDDSSGRSHRAAFVVGRDRQVLLALPWYNPANVAQYEQIFQALGVG